MNKLCQKFLEKEGALTLDELLRIARSKKAIDCHLQQYGADHVNNHLNVRVNAVGERNDNAMSGLSTEIFFTFRVVICIGAG